MVHVKSYKYTIKLQMLKFYLKQLFKKLSIIILILNLMTSMVNDSLCFMALKLADSYDLTYIHIFNDLIIFFFLYKCHFQCCVKYNFTGIISLIVVPRQLFIFLICTIVPRRYFCIVNIPGFLNYMFSLLCDVTKVKLYKTLWNCFNKCVYIDELSICCSAVAYGYVYLHV